jgi:glyoxylate/hydroxypyruvate reductase A
LLQDLGFSVLGWSRSGKSTVGGIKVFAGGDGLKAMVAQSDILVCLLPLTEDTRGIINADLMALLPAGAYIINAARGGHLVERDLLEAIDSGHIAGASLDVFEKEPLPVSSAIWGHHKIRVSPHIGGVSNAQAVLQMVLDGVRAFEEGRPLVNLVDPSRRY